MKAFGVVLTIGIIVGAFFLGRGSKEAPFTSEFVVIDTFVDTDVQYETVEQIRTEIVRLPVLPTFSQDMPKTDSVDVIVPIKQYHFKDSTYEATISGYNVSLDRISIFPKTTYKIKNTIKKPRWAIGLQAGYGFCGETFHPYIGIGIQMNLFSW